MFYFTPLTGVLFNFPSRYLFTIGLSGVFSLTRWFWQIPTKFHLLRGTRVYFKEVIIFSSTGFSPSMIKRSSLFHFEYKHYVVVLQPHNCLNNHGLGYSPFARHYLGNHFCFLFLRVLRCFSSPGLPPCGY